MTTPAPSEAAERKSLAFQRRDFGSYCMGWNAAVKRLVADAPNPEGKAP